MVVRGLQRQRAAALHGDGLADARHAVRRQALVQAHLRAVGDDQRAVAGLVVAVAEFEVVEGDVGVGAGEAQRAAAVAADLYDADVQGGAVADFREGAGAGGGVGCRADEERLGMQRAGGAVEAEAAVVDPQVADGDGTAVGHGGVRGAELGIVAVGPTATKREVALVEAQGRARALHAEGADGARALAEADVVIGGLQRQRAAALHGDGLAHARRVVRLHALAQAHLRAVGDDQRAVADAIVAVAELEVVEDDGGVGAGEAQRAAAVAADGHGADVQGGAVADFRDGAGAGGGVGCRADEERLGMQRAGAAVEAEAAVVDPQVADGDGTAVGDGGVRGAELGIVAVGPTATEREGALREAQGRARALHAEGADGARALAEPEMVVRGLQRQRAAALHGDGLADARHAVRRQALVQAHLRAVGDDQRAVAGLVVAVAEFEVVEGDVGVGAGEAQRAAAVAADLYDADVQGGAVADFREGAGAGGGVGCRADEERLGMQRAAAAVEAEAAVVDPQLADGDGAAVGHGGVRGAELGIVAVGPTATKREVALVEAQGRARALHAEGADGARALAEPDMVVRGLQRQRAAALHGDGLAHTWRVVRLHALVQAHLRAVGDDQRAVAGLVVAVAEFEVVEGDVGVGAGEAQRAAAVAADGHAADVQGGAVADFRDGAGAGGGVGCRADEERLGMQRAAAAVEAEAAVVDPQVADGDGAAVGHGGVRGAELGIVAVGPTATKREVALVEAQGRARALHAEGADGALALAEADMVVRGLQRQRAAALHGDGLAHAGRVVRLHALVQAHLRAVGDDQRAVADLEVVVAEIDAVELQGRPCADDAQQPDAVRAGADGGLLVREGAAAVGQGCRAVGVIADMELGAGEGGAVGQLHSGLALRRDQGTAAQIDGCIHGDGVAVVQAELRPVTGLRRTAGGPVAGVVKASARRRRAGGTGPFIRHAAGGRHRQRQRGRRKQGESSL
jgi:hypothetical protein